MHRVKWIAAGFLLALTQPLAGQNLTVECGDSIANAHMAVEFADRFTSADSAFVEYRLRNGFRLVADSEPIGAVKDAAVCSDLASRIESSLRANAWQYWGNVQRKTYFMRFGPYYYVYVRGLLPQGSVGAGGFAYYVFDVATLGELPLVFDFP